MAICSAINKYGINKFSLYILESIEVSSIESPVKYLSSREDY
jgi:hypothetical protein